MILNRRAYRRTLPALVAILGLGWGVAPHAQAGTAGRPAVDAAVRVAATAAKAPASFLRVEPMGDSITSGYQSSNGNGYRGPLWDELTEVGHRLDFVGSLRSGTMSDPDNEGHSGWRIDQLADVAKSSLSRHQPNVVTLMIGTNDLGQGHEVSTAPARLSSLIDQISETVPSASVLVANLVISTNTEVAAAAPAYNAAIPPMVEAKQAAGKRVGFVDMSALTTADLFDALHPNDSGYQKIAAAWGRGIQAAEAAGWITPPADSSASPSGPPSAVVSGIAGKCLDVRGGSGANGTAVQLYGCNRTPAQAWTPYSDTTLRALGKCLEAADGGAGNGTRVMLDSCDGGGAQEWQSYRGGYRNLDSGRCLEVPGGSTADGTQAVIWDCNGGSNQRWTSQALSGPVTSGIAGKCLDAESAGTANGTKVVLWDCNNGPAQQWTVSGKTVQFGGKCLDIVAASTANGALINLWDCTGEAHQEWTAVNQTLVNPASGKCLDVPGFSTRNGTQLDLWDCDGGTNQRWTVAPV